MYQSGKIYLAHHGRHNVRILQMEVVVRTIQIGWHHSYIIGAILQVVALAHLKTRNLGYSILFVGVFKGRCKQSILLHRLRRVLGIYTGRTKEEQLLYPMTISVANDIALHLHVLHDKVGSIERVCHNATHKSGCKYNGIGALGIEESLNCILVGKVEFGMGSAYKIVITTRF